MIKFIIHLEILKRAPAAWPFNQPFYLLLNIAVGGNWGGHGIDHDVWPQKMLVDYVRVYKIEDEQIADYKTKN